MKLSTHSHNPVCHYGVPCSLTGALCALSGIDGIAVLVNGPSSCTGFATGLIDGCHPLKERNALCFSRLARNGHPRIPCSEITDADVILGIGEKLLQAAEKLENKRRCEHLAIVNSCSLSLIGEDVPAIFSDHALSDKILFLESTGCGKTASQGFCEALIKLIEAVSPDRSAIGKTAVNILGLPINQYAWKHDNREIRHLMTLAGLEVNTVLSAGCTLEEIRRLPAAALNVVINPDYGLDIARFMQTRFNTPYIATDHLPIGFETTRRLMAAVLCWFNLSAPARLIEEEHRCRREAFLALSHSARTEMIRGLPVAVFGEWGFVSGLSLFLETYLGCRVAVKGIQGRDTSGDDENAGVCAGARKQSDVLFNPHMDQALAALEKHRPVIIFGSAFEQHLLARATYSPSFFIQTTAPGFSRTNIVYRPHIGYNGALTFIEAILNCRLTAQYPYSVLGNKDRTNAQQADEQDTYWEANRESRTSRKGGQ